MCLLESFDRLKFNRFKLHIKLLLFNTLKNIYYSIFQILLSKGSSL